MQNISALMDGELEPGETPAALAALKRDDGRESWETYHLIGDVLRGSNGLSPEFSNRLRQQLAQEPTVLAPRKPLAQRVRVAALSAAASLAAVAVVGWVAFSDNALRPQPAGMASRPPQAKVQLAQAQAPAKTPPAANPQLDEYLMAHQEFSPSTRMQGVAPYIRMVSAQDPAP